MNKHITPRLAVYWNDAKRFVETIAGEPDPLMCWQTFDDKGANYKAARMRHGRLSDPELRKWLLAKQATGCGIYVCVNETDGQGRRRENIVSARSAWVDMDGVPLPKDWPVEPHMIEETSPGRYQAFWALDPEEDLNAVSDLQARLAAYFGGDPSVTDPPRVCRVPGFYHQKREPFRSRIVESVEPETVALDSFSRHIAAEIAERHPCEYVAPSLRAEGGRSTEPEGGFDKHGDVRRARTYLKTAPASIEGQRGNDNAYRVACKLNDLGISPELSLGLMTEDGGWNDRCEPPWSDEELKRIIAHANNYKHRSAGSASPSSDFAAVTDEETQADEEAEDECSEGGFRIGGLDFTYGSAIRSEAIEWLWDQRFPIGMLSMVVGFPELGKSQICCSIAACVTKGKDWPNHEGGAPKGAALILSAEDSPGQTLKPRLVAAGADMSQVLVTSMTVRTEQGRRMMNLADDLKHLSAGVQTARKSGRVFKVVIIDPISAYMGGKAKGNTWNQTDVRAILAPVAEWAQRERVAVIAISHFNKGGNSHTLYRVSDSIGFTAAARAVWFCVADKEEGGRKLFVKAKGSVARADVPGLSYWIASKALTLDDGQVREAPYIQWGEEVSITAEQAMAERKEESPALAAAIVFLRSLLAKGPMLLEEIRDHVNASEHSQATIKRAKAALQIVTSKEGFKDGKWRWSLPEDDAEDFG